MKDREGKRGGGKEGRVMRQEMDGQGVRGRGNTQEEGTG